MTFLPLHSTVVLLKVYSVASSLLGPGIFTFYCSSIKSGNMADKVEHTHHFTFYCSSIKRSLVELEKEREKLPLHSTVVLLKVFPFSIAFVWPFTLHSTVVLLKVELVINLNILSSSFLLIELHSTVVLLKGMMKKGCLDSRRLYILL